MRDFFSEMAESRATLWAPSVYVRSLFQSNADSYANSASCPPTATTACATPSSLPPVPPSRAIATTSHPPTSIPAKRAAKLSSSSASVLTRPTPAKKVAPTVKRTVPSSSVRNEPSAVKKSSLSSLPSSVSRNCGVNKANLPPPLSGQVTARKKIPLPSFRRLPAHVSPLPTPSCTPTQKDNEEIARAPGANDVVSSSSFEHDHESGVTVVGNVTTSPSPSPPASFGVLSSPPSTSPSLPDVLPDTVPELPSSLALRPKLPRSVKCVNADAEEPQTPKLQPKTVNEGQDLRVAREITDAIQRSGVQPISFNPPDRLRPLDFWCQHWRSWKATSTARQPSTTNYKQDEQMIDSAV